MLMSLVHTFASSRGRGSLLIPIPWNLRRRRESTPAARTDASRHNPDTTAQDAAKS